MGTVEVSYREQMPRADEGPFLKEERKLIETIADRIAGHIMQRRLKTAFDGLIAAADGHVASEASGASSSSSCATPIPFCCSVSRAN